jgi:LemA protein
MIFRKKTGYFYDDGGEIIIGFIIIVVIVNFFKNFTEVALLITLAIFILIVLFSIIGVYNTLNRLLHSIYAARADIDNTMNKRISIVKNIIDVTNSFAGFEKEIINITLSSESNLKNAMMYVSLWENRFPDIASGKHYMQLKERFEAMETEVQANYKTHNDIVRSYNTKRTDWFPRICVFLFGGFSEAEYLDSSKWQTGNPQTLIIRKPEK